MSDTTKLDPWGGKEFSLSRSELKALELRNENAQAIAGRAAALARQSDELYAEANGERRFAIEEAFDFATERLGMPPELKPRVEWTFRDGAPVGFRILPAPAPPPTEKPEIPEAVPLPMAKEA